MSDTKEVSLTPAPHTQSGKQILQKEHDPKPVLHTSSLYIPRRPSGGGLDTSTIEKLTGSAVSATLSTATTAQPLLEAPAVRVVQNFAVRRRPSSTRDAGTETPLPEVAEDLELDESTAKRIAVPKTPLPEVAEDLEFDEPATLSIAAPETPLSERGEAAFHFGFASNLGDVEPSTPTLAPAHVAVVVQPVLEAPADRVVQNFAIPRRPSTARYAAPETPLPEVAEDLELDELTTLSIAAPETPLPEVVEDLEFDQFMAGSITEPEALLRVGPASALGDTKPDMLAVPSVHVAVAAPPMWEQETFDQIGTYDLSVVVPTRNEWENVRPLLELLRNALWGMQVEVIFVDDSDDTTVEAIKDAANMLCTPLFHVHVEHRFAGKERDGGLATAVVLGMDRAQAEYVAVIDADLQHPPEQLRVLYDHARAQDADVVVASRYIRGGSNHGLANGGRRFISVVLKWAAKLLFPGHVLRISDPLSGFFLVRRSRYANVALRPVGYKILLEILIRCPWQQALEVPYRFGARSGGQSKSTFLQGLLALGHMARLWREVPAAGRSWKIVLLLLLNVLVALTLFNVGSVLPTVWSELNVVVFGLMGCLDFVLCNRFVFPSPIASATSTGKLSSEHAASVDSEITASRRAVGTVHMDSHRVHSIAETETFKLPSIAERETFKLPSMGRRSAFLFGLSRAFKTPRMNILRERVRRGAAIAAVLLAVCWIIYKQPGAPLALAVLLMGLPLALAKSDNRDQAITMTLALAVGVATLDYMSWRLTATNWSAWWISVPLLCAEVFGALHVLGFQYTIWPWSPPQAVTQGEDPTRLPIFIFIPTANEGTSILEPTLRGSIAAREKYLSRYPHGRVSIVVCNDGRVAKATNWEEIETLAQRLGVACVTRSKGGGAKAGNIENARQEVGAKGDALLVIFDADQIATPDFLLKTIPHFRDPKLGWVQTGQYYANQDNPVSRWADDQQSMFYNLLCPGKAAINAAFICGTNVVIRTAAIDQIGGLPQDSVTEDFAASIALHPSWRSIYLTDVLANGLGPLDVPSYLKQQGRWALGTLGVFRSHWMDILLPKKHGLQLGQRIQYFLACTHYLCGLRDLIYLLCPLCFILTGIPAVRGSYLSEYLWHFLPYAVLSAASLWYAARGVTGLRGIIIGFGSFPVLITSMLSVLTARKVSFAVTAKQRGGKRSLSYLGVYCFFFLLCIACLLLATQLKGQQQTSLFISLLWVVYSLIMLGSFLWLNLKDLLFHASVQRSGAPDVTLANQLYASPLLKRRGGLNPLWNMGLAVLLAAPILVGNAANSLALFTGGQASPFVISNAAIAAPYLGLTLPVQLLTDRPPVLERELGTQFTIIGRTQDILHDHFDNSWANQLAAHGARPWITLQFGVFGPNQKPPLDANLSAIINGVDDGEITRWAEDIRAYGTPIYLTILQHADRNWSLSSGVANGGIPQDVPRAWMHVKSVFRAEGANNVAWVWAPADPINDQAFAPPVSTIDAVLQSFIDYPGTTWGNPETVLQKLVQRYPTKPIFVEASVAGPAAQKAEWLSRLGLASEEIPHVYALFYHEGGPGLDPNSAQSENWSFESDPTSLAAMRQIVLDLANRRSSSAFSCRTTGQASSRESTAQKQRCFR